MADYTDQDLWEYALAGLEERQKQIEEQMQKLRQRLGSSGSSKPPQTAMVPAAAGKRQLTAAARERMARAQRKRWAATRKSTASEAVVPAAKETVAKKRMMSPEARERIAAAQRKRWAAARKGS